MTTPMGIVSAILLTASIFAPAASAAYSTVNDSNCDCYRTNGTTANWFSDHQFFDFRSLPQYAGVPTAISNSTASKNASATSDYFRAENWTSAWSAQTWANTARLNSGKASIYMTYSQSNVYIQTLDDPTQVAQTALTLRTVRFADFQSAAEIDSVIENYQYGSIRVRARTLGSPGAITAMFTYRAPTDSEVVQEADLEVRTQDPKNYVQYTNQPSAENDGNSKDTAAVSTKNVTLPSNLAWTDWADHRLDWNPDSSTWYVNGLQVAQITYQTPQDGSVLIFNVWGDGGTWAGNMSTGGAAYMQIQWIEMVFNVTANSTSGASAKSRRETALGEMSRRATNSSTCKNVCSIDEVQQVGTTVLLQANVASSALGQLGACVAPWASLFAISAMIVLGYMG